MKPEEILELIKVNLIAMDPILDKKMIDRNSKLCLLGFGSVGRAELIEKMLEDLNLELDRFKFHSASDLGELSDLLLDSKEINLSKVVFS